MFRFEGSEASRLPEFQDTGGPRAYEAQKRLSQLALKKPTISSQNPLSTGVSENVVQGFFGAWGLGFAVHGPFGPSGLN